MHLKLIRILIVLCLLGLARALPAQPAAAKKKMVDDKPVLLRTEPRGIQRGTETRLKLIGTNLEKITQLKVHHPKLKGELIKEGQTNGEVWIELKPAGNIERGSYDISVVNARGESGKLKVHVDDLQQVQESETTDSAISIKRPFSYWGTLDPAGDFDEVEFTAKAKQQVVVFVDAKSIGSKANVIVSLVDGAGHLLGSNDGFEGSDPLLFHEVRKTGKYKLRISEKMMGGSIEHFYHVSVGELPVVTGIFPLSVRTNTTATVGLLGYNVSKVRTDFVATRAGELDLPVGGGYTRTRQAIKVLINDGIETRENEPNDSSAQASQLTIPSVVSGQIWDTKANKSGGSIPGGSDVDLFHFIAKAGQKLVFETDAARRGSPIDTKIEILHEDGRPVERLLLQSVRDSQINFRSIDSNIPDVRVDNWEEMELNELMYLKGEVCKVFRMPEGPDSGFQFYKNGAMRISYFNTSPTAHAMDEPCYIVEAHPPGTKLVPTGLPTFTLHYANDDDGERELGSDSRLLFTAPKEGRYLLRVTDTRGFSGERFVYRLAAREAVPGYSVDLTTGNITVPPGSGQEFSLTVNRMDGFDDEITIEMSNVPKGYFISTPLVIQAGHLQVTGTIFASPDAAQPTTNDLSRIKITATAMINGKTVTNAVKSFEKFELGKKPNLIVAIEPYSEADTNFNVRGISDQPLEVTVIPGQVVPMWLKIKRDGHEDLVTFSVNNLPHGVIVDNIGLSGVLIPKGENERQIFLRCAKWVPETDRLAYCRARQSGNPTSLPVLIKVRHTKPQTASN